MSKIEKALSRAKSERSLVVVSSRPSAAPDRGEQHLVPVQPAADRGSLGAGAISAMRETARRDTSELAQLRIIAPEMADNVTVQAFRELRTRILQRTGGRNATIMVTSAVAAGGSSFVALNLGAAFAFDSAKTALVMDCNLRSPRFQTLLPDVGARGLTDYLENDSLDVAEIIHAIGVDRLRIVPAGGRRDVPAEYFTSVKMKHLMGAIMRRYPDRFVIVDAPPMTDSADTRILAELCDYVLLVVPYGKVTDSAVDGCLKAIEAKKLLGVVFNDEPHVPTVDWTALIRRPFDPLIEKVVELWHKRKKK
jgi:protein-tyrosine kinase